MAVYQGRIAAAVALVGADLFTGEVWARSPRNRTLKSFGMVGSAAIGDAEVDLMIDEVRMGNFFNSTTGVIAPRYDDMIKMGNLFVPAGALLRALVRDAATTNPLAFMIELADMLRR